MRSSSAPSTEARTGPRAVHGTVFDVQRFALHDGPGIRTTVFLKGCPLRCGWCQNPESWLRRPQVVGGRTIGEVTTAGRVMEQVLRDRDYYAASGGGLTVSGGEPLAQADFTAALLELAHDAGVHTCLDTSGWAPERTIRFGLAAGCLKHSIPGDFNLVSEADVEALVGEGRYDVKR